MKKIAFLSICVLSLSLYSCNYNSRHNDSGPDWDRSEDADFSPGTRAAMQKFLKTFAQQESFTERKNDNKPPKSRPLRAHLKDDYREERDEKKEERYS